MQERKTNLDPNPGDQIECSELFFIFVGILFLKTGEWREEPENKDFKAVFIALDL